MLLGEEKIKTGPQEEEKKVFLASAKKWEKELVQEPDAQKESQQARIQELTAAVRILKIEMEKAEEKFQARKSEHEGVFKKFKSLFVQVTLGEAQKEQEALEKQWQEAKKAYQEKLAVLEAIDLPEKVETDGADVRADEVVAVEQDSVEIVEEKPKKARVRKAKKAEAAAGESVKDHFAVFQKHIAQGKATSAIRAFRRALAKDVSWKEMKKLTLGQAVLKFCWHEDAEIKKFLHNLREMVGSKGVSTPGETLHEWTQRLSELALEQAGDEEQV